MRAQLLTARGWQVGLLSGSLFGSAVAGLLVLADETTPFVLITSVVGGAFFGTGTALATIKQRRAWRAALAGLPRDRWRAVGRAAFRGPVPADPAIRAAATRLAEQHLDQYLRQRRVALAVFGFNLVLAVFNTLANSRWHLLLAIGWIGLLVAYWRRPRRLRQRVELLSEKS